MKAIRALAGGLFLAALLGGTVHAADLRGKLPAESVLYLEFTGTEAHAEAFGETPLGKMLADPALRGTLDALLGAFHQFIAAKAAEEQVPPEMVTAGQRVAHVLYRRGFAVDVLDFGMGPAGPTVAAVLAISAGEEAEALQEAIEKLMAVAGLPPAAEEDFAGKALKVLPPLGPGAPPLRYGVVDGVFLLMLGEQTPQRLFAAMSGTAPTLATNRLLNTALERTKAGTANYVALGFLDAERGLAQARELFGTMTGGADFPPSVSTFLTATGLEGAKSVTVVSQVTGGAFRNSFLAECPAPRKGLVRLMEQAPLADDDLLWIPKDAEYAFAANFDLGGSYDAILGLFGTMGPEVDEARKELEQVLGMRLREDLLAAFGDGLAFFDAPSQGGFFFSGLAIVLETPNEADAQRVLQGLTDSLAKWLNGEQHVAASLRSIQYGGRDVYYLTFPGTPIPVAPAWGILNQHVVFGLAPQTVKLTLDRVGGHDAKAASILANEDFQRGRQQLPEKLVQLTYVDTKRTMRWIYPFALLLSSAGINAAAPHAPSIDIAALPDVNQFTKDLFADVSGVSVDDQGIMQVAHGPLPLSQIGMLASSGNATVLGLSIVVPSLSRARFQAKRAASIANLRSIGLACHAYANEHDGKFPNDLSTLMAPGYLPDRNIFIAPLHGGPEPSYTYIPGHTVASSTRWVVAYEDFPGLDEGAAVLFLDGHVEFVKPLSRVQELVEQTKQEMAAKG